MGTPLPRIYIYLYIRNNIYYYLYCYNNNKKMKSRNVHKLYVRTHDVCTQRTDSPYGLEVKRRMLHHIHVQIPVWPLVLLYIHCLLLLLPLLPLQLILFCSDSRTCMPRCMCVCAHIGVHARVYIFIYLYMFVCLFELCNRRFLFQRYIYDENIYTHS